MGRIAFKKLLSLLIFLSLLTTIAKPIYGEETIESKNLEILFTNINYNKSENIRVILDNKELRFDITPQIINGRTLVPMRAIFESLGLTVSWNKESKKASVVSGGKTIEFIIGSNTAIVNNKEENLDVPASIIEGRTLIPLRFLSENMGYNVVWIGESNLILLSKKDIVEWRYGGYEIIEPYKEYEVKYVNGILTDEIRHTSNTKQQTNNRVEIAQDYLYRINSDDTATIIKYLGYETKCIIPEKLNNHEVVKIDNAAFDRCYDLISVIIPHTVTTIGEAAFNDCESLTNISIPKSVVNVDLFAFADTPWLDEQTSEFVIVGDGILLDYNGNNSEVVVPNNVKSIVGAFKENKNIKSIYIPNSVTNISDSSFNKCENLLNIELPNTLETIGKNVFYECSSLENIDIPISVKKIGGWTFKGTPWLENKTEEFIIVGDGVLVDYNGENRNVFIPNNVKSLSSPFNENKNITNIEIPNSITSIDEVAFYDLDGLKTINIPSTVEIIDDWAFADCSNLTDIKIPSSIESIGKFSFYNCSNLSDITISHGLKSIADNAFYLCTSLKSINLPDSVTSVGKGCFFDCSNLTDIKLPDSITYIGDFAFSDCDALANIKISNSVIYIGEYTFSDCMSLNNIDIPDSVIYIGDNAFYSCDNLNKVNISNNLKYVGDNVFTNTQLRDNKTDEFVTVGNILIRYNGPGGNVSIPNNVKFINCWFGHTENITNVKVPYGVVGIGNNAFNGCNELKNLHIPDTVVSIGESAFNYCNSLKSIILPNKLKYIRKNTFNGCTNLKEINLSNNIKSIGEAAFGFCRSLETINLPKNIYNISDSLFYQCTKLNSIEIPNSVTSIGSYAFNGCENLKSIKMPNNITSIKDFAFNLCTNLSDIVLSKNIINIGDSAFAFTPWLENQTQEFVIVGDGMLIDYNGSGGNVIIPDNVKSLGSAFVDNSSIISVEIPNSVTSIGFYDFYGCVNLESVIIPESVTDIGNMAFFESDNVTLYVYGGSYAEEYAEYEGIPYEIIE